MQLKMGGNSERLEPEAEVHLPVGALPPSYGQSVRAML